MTKAQTALLAVIACVVALAAWWWQRTDLPAAWTDAEVEFLRTLWIGNLPPVPPSPSNAVADDPHAADFGRRLFFDPRLSGNGAVSCATCHQPGRAFTDGLPKGRAIGESARNTRSIVAAAYSPWQYWDGRKDSLWSQALAPLEDPREHGGTRMQYARLIAETPQYRSDYEALFGPLPDFSDSTRFPASATPVGRPQHAAAWQAMTAVDRRHVDTAFANIGKSLAAYERQLVPGSTRFDRYALAAIEGDTEVQNSTFARDEVRGLRLFVGKARCVECHNGPLFTNNEFHNTGILSPPGEVPDRGRIGGLRIALNDPFNCSGNFSDDPQRHCAELSFARSGIELLGAMRTPTLRNVAQTPPFMHKGQLATLAEVLEHYNLAPLAMIGHNEAEPLGLSRRELADLEAFLNTLSGPVVDRPELLQPPVVSEAE
jgi:cytochrome c peroxidase